MTNTDLTGREILLRAFRNEATPRAAWIAFVGVHGGKMIGVSAADYLQSSDLIVSGLIKAHERYRPDGLPVVFDLQMEAEVLGCQLRWAEQTPPSVATHPLAELSLAELPQFDVDKGRYPLVLEALRTVKGRLGESTALYGLITGPFTLCLHLLGTNVFLDMYQAPEKVRDIIGFCTDVCSQAADAYLANGADVVAVVDPMTSQISPEHFQEFVSDGANRVFEHVRSRGGLSSMFVCGDATRNLECMCQTACDNVSVDENVPLDLLKELACKHGKSFGGNLKLTAALLMGTPDDAKLDAIRCIELGGTNGFILAPGCDLPYGVPEENLEAVAQMVHDEYERNTAGISLRARAACSYEDIVLPAYGARDEVYVDVITLDSASCAPCLYMMNAAQDAADTLGEGIVVRERKITTREGVGFMTRLGVANLPTICIDGEPRFVSIIPDGETLAQALRAARHRKTVI